MNTEHLDIHIADNEGIETGFHDENGRSAPWPDDWETGNPGQATDPPSPQTKSETPPPEGT